MNDRHDAFTLLDLAREPIVVLDANGRLRYLNAAVEELLGHGSSELLGVDAVELVHADDADEFQRRLENIVAGDRDPSRDGFEYRVETADGNWVWLRSWFHPPDETDVDGYVVSSRDVTGEVETRERLEEIAAKSPDVLWMFTADWEELLFVNDAIETVFGIGPERLAQYPTAFLEHVHPEDRARVKRAMYRLSEGESIVMEYRVDPSTEYSTWVRVLAEPIRENGEVVRVSGFARDVSEEYRRNRQITVMDNLLRHTIRNDMNVITGTASRIIDTLADRNDDGFTRGSHKDGRRISDHGAHDGGVTANPDGGVTANPDGGTTTDTDGGTVAEMTLHDGVVEHAKTIRRVGEELLDTAEKQRDVIELLNRDETRSTTDLAEMAEEVIEDARRTFPTARFDVETPPQAVAETHPKIDCALTELVENAVEHAEKTPDVRVAVDRSDDGVEITVRDNCEPIPREEALVVTDRREMTELYHTDGMGLWLVYWAVERSEGRLLFDTHDDGNVVTLLLPNAADDD